MFPLPTNAIKKKRKVFYYLFSVFCYHHSLRHERISHVAWQTKKLFCCFFILVFASFSHTISRPGFSFFIIICTFTVFCFFLLFILFFACVCMFVCACLVPSLSWISLGFTKFHFKRISVFNQLHFFIILLAFVIDNSFIYD